MRAVPEPFRPAAAATSQRVLVDPAGWMRPPEPAGPLTVLQAAVFSGRRRLGYRSSDLWRCTDGSCDRNVPGTIRS